MPVTRYIAELAANTGLTESAFAPTIHLKSAYDPGEWNKRILAETPSNFRDPDFIGNMEFTVSGKSIWADVFTANEYGPDVYRYETPTMRHSKERRIIKINMARGMAYFVTEESLERDDPVPVFEKKGNKIKWFSVHHEGRLK